MYSNTAASPPPPPRPPKGIIRKKFKNVGEGLRRLKKQRGQVKFDRNGETSKQSLCIQSLYEAIKDMYSKGITTILKTDNCAPNVRIDFPVPQCLL